MGFRLQLVSLALLGSSLPGCGEQGYRLGGAAGAEPPFDNAGQGGSSQVDAAGNNGSGGGTDNDAGSTTPERDAESSGCLGVETDPKVVDQREAPVRASHRAAAEACAVERPCNHVNTGAPASVCSSHEDCLDGRNGRCQSFGYECTYDSCFSDAECPSGMLCDCAGGLNGSHRCLTAACRVDADCAAGALCSPSASVQCYNLYGVVGYFCHTPSDECTVDADCAAGACVFDGQIARWRCSTQRCAL